VKKRDFTQGQIAWTITDSDLSADGKFLVHSTLNPYISLFDCEHKQYSQAFNLNPEDNSEGFGYYFRFRVYSVKLSQDSNTILASTGTIDSQQA